MIKSRLFLAVLAVSFFIFEKAEAQKIEFESEVVNFGEAMQGDIVARKWRFQNLDKKPLLIEYAKGSCGCTRPTWPDREIQKGEWAEIGVEFNTAKRADDQSKMIKVKTNDPDRPEIILRLEGIVKVAPIDSSAALAAVSDSSKSTVEPQKRHQIQSKGSKTVGLATIEFQKTTLHFGRAASAELITVVYEFTNTGTEPFLLSSVRDNCNCLKLEYNEGEIIPPSGASAIQVTLDTSKEKAGDVSKTIMVGGNIEGKEILLTLKGKIR